MDLQKTKKLYRGLENRVEELEDSIEEQGGRVSDLRSQLTHWKVM